MLTLLEKVDLLQKAPIFREIRTESLARLAAVAHEASYEARHTLYRENDFADAMYYLIEGEVAILRGGQESNKLRPPQVAGANALLAGGSQPEAAVASQPLRVLCIDQQDFYDVMSEDFEITRGILRTLVRQAAGGV